MNTFAQPFESVVSAKSMENMSMKSIFSKSENTFTVVGSLIGTVIGMTIYHFFSIEERTLPNIAGLIGTLITILALCFSIYQQKQIKYSSQLIEDYSKNYQDKIREAFYSWNIGEAITLCEKLEDLMHKNENLPICSFLLREIQSILADCKKANLIHYSSKLEECLVGLDSDKAYTKAYIVETMRNCKSECKNEWETNFSAHNAGLSVESLELQRKLNNPTKDFDTNKCLYKIIEVRTFLQNIKPDYLTVTNPK